MMLWQPILCITLGDPSVTVATNFGSAIQYNTSTGVFRLSSTLSGYSTFSGNYADPFANTV